MYDDQEKMYSCPICNQETDRLKQFRVLRSIVAIPMMAVLSSTVVRSCPRCMRAFVWKRCLINGLTTWIAGYLILIPYTLALTIATLQKGHSWPVKQGVSPEMHLKRTWIYESSRFEKMLAILSVPICLIPGIGILICWCILWKVRWCTGWVHRMAEITSFVAYIVTATVIGLYMQEFKGKPAN